MNTEYCCPSHFPHPPPLISWRHPPHLTTHTQPWHLPVCTSSSPSPNLPSYPLTFSNTEHTNYCCFHHKSCTASSFPSTMNISCLSLPRHVAYNHHGLPHPHHVDNRISKISTAEIETHPVNSTCKAPTNGSGTLALAILCTYPHFPLEVHTQSTTEQTHLAFLQANPEVFNRNKRNMISQEHRQYC